MSPYDSIEKDLVFELVELFSGFFINFVVGGQIASIKTKYRLVLLFGLASGLTGLLLIALYVMKAIIERAGEPDQSLLVWYFPLVLLGFAALKLGAAFNIWGIVSLRKKREWGAGGWVLVTARQLTRNGKESQDI